MIIEKVLTLTEPKTRNVQLCDRCEGKGIVWSDLEFGDIPGDEKKLKCSQCAGTGRTTTLRLTVDAVVPFDYTL